MRPICTKDNNFLVESHIKKKRKKIYSQSKKKL